MSIWPSCASSAAAISAASRGHRDAHRLDRDQPEDRGITEIRRDIDQRREHRPTVAFRARGDRNRHRVGDLRAAGLHRGRDRRRSTPRGATRSSRRGTSPGVDVLHVSRHGAGHPRLSNHVTHRANIAALKRARRLGRARRDGLRRGRPGAAARLARRASTTCTSSPTGCPTAPLHVLHGAGRARARPLDLRGPVLGAAARRAADRRGRGRRRGPRRRRATATSTARASTPAPRSAASPRPA